MSGPFLTRDQFNTEVIKRLTKSRGGAKPFLTQEQCAALLRFQQEYVVAELDWNKPTPERENVFELEDVFGDTLRRFLYVLLSEGWGLEETEKELGIPSRSGRVCLRIASELLMQFYDSK